MEQWKEYKIGELCKISSSKRIFAYEYTNSGIPFYRGKEIIEKQSGNKISTELYISNERFNEIKQKYGVPQKGDMLLTSVGSLGVPYVVQDETFYFKDGNLTWFSDFNNLDSRYLYYWFLSPEGKYNIDNKSIGSTQKALTIDALSKFNIKLPSLIEQKRISNFLSSLDDKIELNRQINDNLEQQAQALFKSWFVDFEPFKDGEFVNSELGMIPKGWEIVRIGDIKHRLESGRRPKGGATLHGVPSIGAENIKGLGYYDYSKTKYIPLDFANSITKGKVKGFELLIYKDGGKPGYFIPNFSIFGDGFPFEYMFINEHVFLLDFFNPEFNVFTYFYMQTPYIMSQLNSIGGKAAIPGINSANVEFLPIFDLNNNEWIYKFGKLIMPLIQQILSNCKSNMKLTQLRDTLLPRLMSGELKINEINC